MVGVGHHSAVPELELALGCLSLHTDAQVPRGRKAGVVAMDYPCLHSALECPFRSWMLHFQSGFLHRCLGRQHVVGQVRGPLSAMWETQMESLAAGCDQAQTWLFRE